MRIVSGIFRGRRIEPPVSLPVRPTTDFAKEGLFNVLNNMVDFEDLQVLDLFCGTGSIALEFVSRGAESVMAVDINRKCTDFVISVADKWEIGNLQVVRSNCLVFIRQAARSYDLVFADPPYDMKELPDLPGMIFERGLVDVGGWLVLEHGSTCRFDNHPMFSQHRQYGSVNFSFFRVGRNGEITTG